MTTAGGPLVYVAGSEQGASTERRSIERGFTHNIRALPIFHHSLTGAVRVHMVRPARWEPVDFDLNP
jgi:hypothetical protein